jgi:hypothetical protein
VNGDRPQTGRELPVVQQTSMADPAALLPRAAKIQQLLKADDAS